MKLHSFRRLRFRLALRQTLFFAVLVSLLAWAAYGVMARRIYDEVDHQLQDRSVAVRSMLQIRTSGITWLKEQADPEVREQFENSIRYYQLLDSDGRLIESSSEIAALRVPVTAVARQALETGQSGWESFTAGGVHLRILDSRVVGLPGHHYLMRLGASLAHADGDSHALAVFIVVLFPVVILAHGVICWMMAGRALSPIEQLSAAARQITPRDLTRRLPLSGRGDEVEHLSATLNSMISGFQISFQRMSEFLSNLSHELRQPLTLLRAETEQALRHGNMGESDRQMLSKQLEHVELLGRTVSDLVALARSDYGGIQLQLETEDLSELVRAAVDGMHSTAMEHKIHLAATVQDSIVGQFDAGQIWRLLLNLIDNGIKFNRPNGRVDVALISDGAAATITVADTGAGIHSEEQELIFERSYRTLTARRSSVPGSGLGLYFVRMIAEAHGGHVDLSSGSGEGACFRVQLPLQTTRATGEFSSFATGSSGANPSAIN
jgi:signal transduction histidine kinase